MSWTVKVYNRGPYPIKEQFKQDIIEIPAGGYVEMDRDDAVEFKGQYRPILTDGEKNPLPQGFKRIEIPDLYRRPKDSQLVHPVTGKVAQSQAEYDEMTKDNIDLLADNDAKEAFVSKMKSDNKDLQARIAELEAQLAAKQRGPGRPKKDTPDEQKGNAA